MNKNQVKVLTVSIMLILVTGTIGFLATGGNKSIITVSSVHYNPDNNTTINTATTLMGNLVTDNLTVDANAILTTNGFQILCNGTFTNYGTVIAGPSTVGNFPESYGGSGGGAWELNNTTLASESGYSTLAAGGIGNDIPGGDAASGRSIPMPALNNSLIQEWFNNGMENYTSGAAGENAGPLHGGLGSFGLYIQAVNIVNKGLITTSGYTGSSTARQIFSGGGGAGVLILAYNGELISGTINVQGGAYGTTSAFDPATSGSGGSGAYLYYHYAEKAPVNTSNIPPLKFPGFAFVGAYANYSVVRSVGLEFSNTSENMSIVSVNHSNQTFTFNENAPTVSIPVTYKSEVFTVSFFGPVIFPVVPAPDLRELSAGKMPVDLVPSGSTGNVTPNVEVKLSSGTFNTYELQFNDVITKDYFWIDEQTGLIVREQTIGSNAVTNTLASTNILVKKPSSPVNDLYVTIGLITSLALITAFFIINRSGGLPESESEVNTEITIRTRIMQTRIEELKDMKKKGIIGQEFYEESVARLKRKSE